MTIYSDNAGNHFLGDCIYANHNISYPSVNFLQAHPHSTFSNELSDLASQSIGASKVYEVQSQSLLNEPNNSQPYTLISWTPVSDNECSVGRGRFAITTRQSNSVADSSTSQYAGYFNCALFSNVGFSGNLLYTMPSERLFNLSTVTTPNIGVANSHKRCAYFNDNLPTHSQRSWCGVCDGDSLGLFQYQKDLAAGGIRYHFYYQGLIDNVNTNFNYYSASVVSKSICLFGTINVSGYNGTENMSNNITGVGHYIANTPKLALTTGDAQYPIACSDGQTPTAQWATDMYVFDDNATLGYPAIGRVRNLLLAQGTYTIGKPVRIQGTVQPDNGFNCWLPVGSFAGKTVLMRCYSSVDL